MELKELIKKIDGLEVIGNDDIQIDDASILDLCGIISAILYNTGNINRASMCEK